jgi:hypothetical protein
VREDFFPPPFDFFRVWPEDFRGFMIWIVASKRDARIPFLISNGNTSGFGLPLSKQSPVRNWKCRLSPARTDR